MHQLVTANASAGRTWPSFDGKSQLVGTSPSGMVTVYVDSTLGAPALQNAQDLLLDADRVVAANNLIFGKPGGPVSVIVFAMDGQTDGTGGADHMGCDYQTGANIEVCAAFGNSRRVSALFEAELSECSMSGDLCGYSTGEALSRWCAAKTSNNALSDFATAPQWAQDGKPDFVNRTDRRDDNPDSTGCGMAFLSWVMSQAFGLDRIAQRMVALGDSGTLAQLYANLTGKAASEAWPRFRTAIDALPNGINGDDPFGVFHPAEMMGMKPLDASRAGEVFAAILSAIQTSRSAEYIVAGVQALLSPEGGMPAPAAMACSVRSHRLLHPAKVTAQGVAV